LIFLWLLSLYQDKESNNANYESEVSNKGDRLFKKETGELNYAISAFAGMTGKRLSN